MRSAPRALTIDEMSGLKLRIAYAAPALAAAFPACFGAWGQAVLEGLAATSYVVGMECPGLHSIYWRLAAALLPELAANCVEVEVTATDPRFRLVTLLFRSPALTATIEAFARREPTQIPLLAQAREHVEPDEFVGQSALLVGGSRGLGAATAKLISAGGGRVAITYKQGAQDAKAVTDDILRDGGACTSMRYDALGSSEHQLEAMPFAPNALYYFATGVIRRRTTAAFEPSLVKEFAGLYVEGFSRLVAALRARAPGQLAVFYPSSVYADAAPPGLGEYAAAKRAGEAVAEKLAAEMPSLAVVVKRLPPINTDQNAAVATARRQLISPLAAMAPIVREMHGKLAASSGCIE